MAESLPEMTRTVLADYGWTEAALGKRIGISQPHVNRLKQGKVGRVSFEVGSAIKRLFDDRPPQSDRAA